MATTGTQGSAWQEPSSATMSGERSGGNGASQVSQSAAATVDRIASGAHQAVDRIAAAANSAASQFGVRGEEVLEMKDRALETAREYVRENPIAALAIAVAAGFVLSKLIR